MKWVKRWADRSGAEKFELVVSTASLVGWIVIWFLPDRGLGTWWFLIPLGCLLVVVVSQIMRLRRGDT